MGQTFVVLGGGVDLSVPWVLNSAGILLTLLCNGHNVSLPWVIPLVLAGGCAVGCFNGVGVALFGVPPIIMTLATNVILQGGILVYTAGAPAANAPPLIQFAAVGRVGALPVILVPWALLSAIAWLALSRSAFGRYLYSLGTNRAAAWFSGVPVLGTIVTTYMICGATSALAGILLTGYSGQAYLGMGDPYLFTSIAAVAIGGASILGGSGSYIGTIAGAFSLTLLTSLLPTLNLSNGALLVAYGVVILVTVILSNENFPAIAVLFRRARITAASLTTPSASSVKVNSDGRN
jgi:ribose transport system permease protein